jgi:hypothetical protein
MEDIESLKTIAVLIDAENAQHTKLGVILDELLKHGHVTAKNAYGDWTTDRLKNWFEVLDRLAIRPYHQFVRTSGKNAPDIAMVIDAMDMFHAEDFDAFAIDRHFELRRVARGDGTADQFRERPEQA